MKTRSTAHHTATAALVGALLILAACGLAACGGDDSATPGPTVTVTVAPSASGSGKASGSPSPKATVAAKKQLAIAAASGAKANGISILSSTGAVKQLVAPKAGVIADLAWAPDAARLAYVQAKSMSTGNGLVMVYDLASASAKPVLIGGAKPYAVAGFTWVAPTRMIVAAFTAKGTTWQTNATMFLCDVAAGTSKVAKDSGGATIKGVWPSASADSTAVAFVRFGSTSGSDKVQDLMLFKTDTLAVKKVAHGSVSTDFDSDAFGLPSISPDGSLIYTVAHGSDIGFSCTVYKVAGGKALKTGQMVYPCNGSWDAGSGRLAFGGGPGSGSGLVDGINVWKPGSTSAEMILSYKKLYISSLAWTPKGKQIVFSKSKSYPMNSDLWVVNADGSSPHLLLKNGSEPACAEAPISFK